MAAGDHWAELRREMERILGGWPAGAFDPGDPLGIFQAIKRDADRALGAFEEAGRSPDGAWLPPGVQ